MQKVRVLKGRRAEDSHWIELRLDGELAAVAAVGGGWGAPAGAAEGRGVWDALGRREMQISGGAGHGINADDVAWEAVVKMVRAVWANGVPLVCPSVITGSRERMCRSIA